MKAQDELCSGYLPEAPAGLALRVRGRIVLLPVREPACPPRRPAARPSARVEVLRSSEVLPARAPCSQSRLPRAG